jgi:hypothetical protein
MSYSLGLERNIVDDGVKCVYCNKKLRKFSVSSDWNTRKFHKVCWFKYQDEKKKNIENRVNEYIERENKIKKEELKNEMINIIKGFGWSDKQSKEKYNEIFNSF